MASPPLTSQPLSKKRERRYLTAAFVIGSLVGLVILVGSITAVGSLNNCHQIQRLYRVIEITSARSLKTLPTIAYYKTHPVELQHQLKLAHEQLHAFKVPSCSLPF